MISSFDLYMLLKLDHIRTACEILSILAGLTWIACFFIALTEDMLTQLGTQLKLGAVAFFLLLSGAVLIPTTKQAAIIWGVPKILDSELVKEDLPEEAKEVYGLAKQWLKNRADTPNEEE